jgi:hypothetical protein
VTRLAALFVGIMSILWNPGGFSGETAAAGAARQRCAGFEVVTDSPQRAGAPTRLRVLRAGRIVWAYPDQENAIVSVACRDLTGDRTPELAVETYSGGAHCCTDLTVLSLGSPVRVLLRYGAGNSGVEIKDLDRDGRPELVLGDDTFAYFDDLCFACSPSSFPLVACYRGGRFEDCTRRFPSLLRAKARQWTAALRDELRKPADAAARDYARGAALGLYASHMLLGEEAAGWAAVRALTRRRDIVDWLARHRATVRNWAATRAKKLEQ